MPPVQKSPKVPLIAAASPRPSSELARRGRRTATDANRGSPPESVAPIERNVPCASDRPKHSRSS